MFWRRWLILMSPPALASDRYVRYLINDNGKKAPRDSAPLMSSYTSHPWVTTAAANPSAFLFGVRVIAESEEYSANRKSTTQA
ncbi:hypothetical protein F4780DRAFT_745453 [Xylariomycetidae sp. FL0641]|nr:hypothetical protein F4780DRAFT_745453 [Xylariomycetidae sp. FL0641]